MIEFFSFSCVSFCSDFSSNDQTINTHNQNNVTDDYETNQLTKHLSITQPKRKTNAQDNNAKESTNNSQRQSYPSHDNMLLENNAFNADNADHDLNAIKELKTTKNECGKDSKNNAKNEKLHVVEKSEEKKSEKSLRAAQLQSKLPSRNRYSFENELPVKDPGPYSTTLQQVPNDPKNDDHNERKHTTPSIEDEQLRSQVQKLLIRHQEDLRLVQESDLGITLPKPLTAIISTLHKPQHHSKNMNSNRHFNPSSFDPPNSGRLQPDVVPVKENEIPGHLNLNRRGGLISSSELEEPPPRFHFAETPDDLTIQNATESNVVIDPFNFMSTVQRKFLAQQQMQVNDNEKHFDQNDNKGRNDLAPEMALSEGPLSTSFASSYQAEENNRNNNVANNVSKESKRDIENKKHNSKQGNTALVSKNSRKNVEKSSHDRIDRTRTTIQNKKGYDKELFVSSDVKETSDQFNGGPSGLISGSNLNPVLVCMLKT